MSLHFIDSIHFEKIKALQCGVVGCGWLGLPLARLLADNGMEVHGTTRDMEKVKQLQAFGIQSHQLQQSDFKKSQQWLANLDLLVLNIPPSHFGAEYASAMTHIVKQLNSGCSIIFVSSTSVYPNVNGQVDESTPAIGTHRNGPAVRKAEQQLMSIAKERLTILRMAGLIGGARNPIKYVAGKNLSGGNNPVNLVHREDCIGMILTIMVKEFWGQIINVCATRHPSRKDYYQKMARVYGLAEPLFNNEQEQDYKLVSNLKSRKELGYIYQHDDPMHFT